MAVAAAVRRRLETPRTSAGLSLLFAAGGRPSAPDIEHLLGTGSSSTVRVRVSHRPPDAEGWLELLASGLTFDLTGLAPAEGSDLPAMKHQFGISFDPSQFRFEAIRVAPGPHVAGGGAMVPVVRTMLGLAADLVLPLSAKAVCWHPAHSWMEPGYFSRIVATWLAGGAFPALGLTALEPGEGGVLESTGLGFFAGQEIRIEPLANEPRGETVKLAVRVIDHIIREGPLTSLFEFRDPSGETVLAEPTHDGRHVRIWRNGA